MKDENDKLFTTNEEIPQEAQKRFKKVFQLKPIDSDLLLPERLSNIDKMEWSTNDDNEDCQKNYDIISDAIVHLTLSLGL